MVHNFLKSKTKNSNIAKQDVFALNVHLISRKLGVLLVWFLRASLVPQTVKNLPIVPETRVPSLGQEDPLEKGMATHSNIFAWRIPWTEEPGGLQSRSYKESDKTEWLTFYCDLRRSRYISSIAPQKWSLAPSPLLEMVMAFESIRFPLWVSFASSE